MLNFKEATGGDARRTTGWLHVLAAFELNGPQFGLEALNSQAKYLHKNHEAVPSDTVLLPGLRKIFSAPPMDQQSTAETILHELDALDFSNKARFSEEIRYWLRHKVTGTPMTLLLEADISAS